MTCVVEFGAAARVLGPDPSRRHTLLAGVARGIGQRMVAVVGAQIRIAAVAANEFETENFRA